MKNLGGLRTWWLMALLLSAPRAWAADAPSEQGQADTRRSDAKARYEQGVEAYSAGRFKDAVDHFLAADQLSPSAPLSFNIARAYEKLGDDSGALRWYRDYVRRSPTAANVADVAVLIARYEERLSKKGVQQLTVLSTPSGATVTIGGSPVGVTPWTGDIPPGHHKVELTLRGYSDSTTELDLGPERAQDLVIRLTEAPARADVPGGGAAAPVTVITQAPSTAGQPQSEQKGGLGILPIVVLGAGGAVLGGALTFEILRQSSERQAKRESMQVPFKEKLDAMESRRTTARVLLGIGGGLVLAGGALLVVDIVSSKPKKATALRAGVGPTGATLAGSF
jgi:tetratricopeptide (TPR) repeat protein